MKYDPEKALALLAVLRRRGHALTALILSPSTRMDHLEVIARRARCIHHAEMLLIDLRMLILSGPTPAFAPPASEPLRLA